jgi:hypothetical protein
MIIECIFNSNFLGYKKGDTIFPDIKSKAIPLYICEGDKGAVFKYTTAEGLLSLYKENILQDNPENIEKITKYLKSK